MGRMKDILMNDDNVNDRLRELHEKHAKDEELYSLEEQRTKKLGELYVNIMEELWESGNQGSLHVDNWIDFVTFVPSTPYADRIDEWINKNNI